MQNEQSPKRSLPKWLQEHMVREQCIVDNKNLQEILNFIPKQSKTVHTPTSSWESGDRVSRINLTVLKFFALLFLLPGLGGLVFSAMVSTDYLENLPRFPSPAEQRMTPRNVHGVVVYQTVQEDQRLSVMEYSSVSVFLVGLLAGIIYLEKWSSARQLELEADLLEEVEA
jgi:hypothetical protein